MEAKQAIETNVTVSEADASKQAKPTLIAFDEKDAQGMNTAIAYLQQTQQENQQREAVTHNQIQALLWQAANKYGVDLSAYQFDVKQGGFVKK